MIIHIFIEIVVNETKQNDIIADLDIPGTSGTSDKQCILPAGE